MGNEEKEKKNGKREYAVLLFWGNLFAKAYLEFITNIDQEPGTLHDDW